MARASKLTRIILTAVMFAAVMIPAAPASAHGRLPTGRYYCYQYINAVTSYSYFDLHIRPNNRYAFMTGDERVGSAGRFRHVAGTRRIRFVSGYLHTQGFKGTHKRSPGDQTIRITLPVNNGEALYDCTDL